MIARDTSHIKTNQSKNFISLHHLAMSQMMQEFFRTQIAITAYSHELTQAANWCNVDGANVPNIRKVSYGIWNWNVLVESPMPKTSILLHFRKMTPLKSLVLCLEEDKEEADLPKLQI